MLDMELSSSITAHFSSRPCDFCRTNLDAALSVHRQTSTDRLPGGHDLEYRGTEEVLLSASPPAHYVIANGDLDSSIREPTLGSGGSMKTSTRRFEVERVSVTSSRPFEAVVAALKDAVGRLDLVEFAKASKQAGTFAELKETVDRNLGKTGLMLFMELDHGAVLRKETGLTTPKIVRLVIGNPLLMKEMAKHVPEAGSYAPVTVLVDDRGDSVHLSYDRMASLLAPYGNMEAIAVAQNLDSKIESLFQSVIRI